jgi:hypothetical protein
MLGRVKILYLSWKIRPLYAKEIEDLVSIFSKKKLRDKKLVQEIKRKIICSLALS